MRLKRLVILATFGLFAVASAPAMDAQACKLRRHVRPIGNNANVPIRRIPKARVPSSQAHLHHQKGRYPYKGGRRTPKGVYLFQ